MKSTLILISSLVAAGSAYADAHVSGSFKIVKPDGQTLVAQAPITPATGASPSSIGIIKVKAADAFAYGNGKCAFNVRYEEQSDKGAQDTTNKLYSNDTLVAQNTHIDVKAGEGRSIWTQPYLFAGQNYVKVVVDVGGEHPSVGWVKVVVDGVCQPQPTPAPGSASAPKAEEPKKHAPSPTAPAAMKYGPGTAQWNSLYGAWGYSNFGVTQLKGKGYKRYAALAALNVDLSQVVKVGSVEQGAYNSLMARWASFTGDADFQALMKQAKAGDHK